MTGHHRHPPHPFSYYPHHPFPYHPHHSHHPLPYHPHHPDIPGDILTKGFREIMGKYTFEQC